jgi:hypothetical protein
MFAEHPPQAWAGRFPQGQVKPPAGLGLISQAEVRQTLLGAVTRVIDDVAPAALQQQEDLLLIGAALAGQPSGHPLSLALGFEAFPGLPKPIAGRLDSLLKPLALLAEFTVLGLAGRGRLKPLKPLLSQSELPG